eukprot:772177-Amphidinium_carterae.1
MTTARAAAAEEATRVAWENATQEGHRCFRVAEKLLSRSWIAPCPLPVDGGGRQQQPPPEDFERFTDLLVIALHWAGSPDGPPTSALLAIPEAASHGISDAVARQVDCVYPDGQPVDTAGVVIVLASADYLSLILYESSAETAEVINFLPDVHGAAPLGAAMFASLAQTEPINATSGIWLHQDEQAALRYLTGGALSEELYVSAVEEELPDLPNLLLTECLGTQQTTTRRATGRARRPSVCGISTASNAKALASMLSAKPPSHAPPAQPQPKPQPKPKVSPKASSDREMLTQLLGAVTALGDRMSSIEAAQRAPPMAKVSASFPAAPPPSPPPIAAQPGFLPMASSASGAAMGGLGVGKAPSMIGAPPLAHPPQGVTAYEQSLEEARRLLALPAPQGPPFREDAAPGLHAARERVADVDLRAAVL